MVGHYDPQIPHQKASGWKASQSLRSAAGKIFFIAIRIS